jgi:hypothetical protein
MYLVDKQNAQSVLLYIFFGRNNATVVGMDTCGSGHWLSSNEKIVYVNRVTGEAQARSEGVAEGSLKNMWPIVNAIHYQLDSILS